MSRSGFTIILLCSIGLAACSSPSDSNYTTASITNVIPVLAQFSEPIGKVGLMKFDALHEIPRASGMNGTIRGYVVSHPAISGPLTVMRNGREVPAFSFVMVLRLTNSAGVVGLEVIRGHGEMRVYYHPEGVGEIDGTEEGGAGEVELDDVRFQAELDFQTGTYLIRLHEATQLTKPFTYAGQNQRTPEGRRAQDIMYGEVAFDLRGLAVASSITLASATPVSRFLSLSKKGSF